MPNTREWALLIWLAAFLLWVAAEPRIRPSAASLLRAAANARILTPLVAMVGWVGLEVWLATRVVTWNPELTKGTVVWFITTGIVLFGNFDAVSKHPHYFRDKAIEALAWTAFVEFYLDLYHFPLVWKIVLQPLLAVLAVLSIVAARKEEHRHARFCAEGVLAFGALAIFAYVTFQTISDWGALDKQGMLLEFSLPVWLTFGALPFIFLLANYAGYEELFARLGTIEDISRARRVRSWLAILVTLRLRVREHSGITVYCLRSVAEAPTFRAALATVQDHRADRRRAALKESEEKERLARLAGVSGADADGRQLDRREFEGTTDALLWLSTCMMGWYKKANRYRDDLLDIVGDGFDRYGLPTPARIELRVSENGQAWYAWRRTVTGWCFAIGAAGPPPEQWQYDGSEPPNGFPGADAAWGDSPFSAETCRNW